MHAYIKMKTDPSSSAVPIQYNYLVQAAIYSAQPEETLDWLHDQGYAACPALINQYLCSATCVNLSRTYRRCVSASIVFSQLKIRKRDDTR